MSFTAVAFAKMISELALRGILKVSDLDFEGKIMLGIGISKAKHVLLLEANRLDVIEMVHLAGKMTDNLQLQKISGSGDSLVFSDLKFYFSTGAEYMGVLYERGIHIKGAARFFGKTGDFDGRFNEDGVVIKAGLDNFKVGGLEVTSTRAGVDRATLDIEMTTEKQKIFIDGMIRYYDFELKIFLDADVQNKKLDADIAVRFTDVIQISLKAHAEYESSDSLEGVVIEFEAELNADIFGAIFDGIKQGITSLERCAVQAIEKAEAELQRQIDEKQGEVDSMRIKLESLKLQSEKQIRIKEEEIEEENKDFLEARQKLDHLEQAVKTAELNKQANEDIIRAQKLKRDAAQRELDNKVREKTAEYEAKIEKENRRQWDAEKKRLQDAKEASWGDDLRKYESAERSWAWWTRMS